MGGLEVVGSAIAQTRRRNSFVELGRALGGVTAADITELKLSVKHPPEGVKAAMVACLVALGYEHQPALCPRSPIYPPFAIS